LLNQLAQVSLTVIVLGRDVETENMKNMNAVKRKIGTLIRNRAVKSGELIRKLFIKCPMTIRFIRKHTTIYVLASFLIKIKKCDFHINELIVFRSRLINCRDYDSEATQNTNTH